MRRISRLGPLVLALCLLAFGLPAAAYDPPEGGLLIPLFGSPYALASGLSVTNLDAPWADRLNPAASAAQQRPVLEAGYTLLSDFASQGVGTGLALGATLPRPYAVWGAGLRYVGIPASMTDMPLGGIFEARASIAKDLFPNLYVGSAVNLALGSNSGFGWGLGLDLGMIHKLGDLGALKDFRYGVVLSGLGKGYTTGAYSSYPSAFTLSGGAHALLIKTEGLSAGMGLDLSFPSFQDLGLAWSADLVFNKLVTLRMGWGFPSVRELVGGDPKSLLPSIGLSAVIPIERKSDESFISRQGWDRSEIRPILSAAPLYGNIWAIGTGASIPLGVLDRTPPLIEASFPTTPWGPFYLSPNSDGTKDLLEIPLKITDQRYLISYTMSVRGGESQVVRSIANKENRPETAGFSGLWDRLVYVKHGIPVPPSLSWNGVADSGEVVPDGNYEIYIEATDDNGNRSEIGPFPVVVDNTPPAAELGFPKDSLIFSPDGDGNKDTMNFPMKGSVEDLWSASILDASGKVVRLVEFKNAAPTDFLWDGKNDKGIIVPDGVYGIVLTATDRGGNSTTRRVDNIVVNTQQAPINLAIDIGAFSPNGDGVRDVVNLSPSIPVKTGLVSFRLSVVDANKNEVWSIGGSEAAAIKASYPFDGKGNNLATLPEGSYQAKLEVSYINGHSPTVSSPSFVLDLTPPRAAAQADRNAFNPAGSAGQNHILFSQSGSSEERWVGEIIGPEGRTVRSWNFGRTPESVLEWDGTDEAGALLPDGVYVYRLKTTDRAGNSFTSEPSSVSLDTEKKAARISGDLRAFSPNGDGQKDVIRLSSQVQSGDRLRSYELDILNAEDEKAGPVRVWKGDRGLPDSFVWNGLQDDRSPAPEGRYQAKLSVRYQNDDFVEARSLPFVLDLTPPTIALGAEPLLFSPNGDGRRDTVRISQKSSSGDDWEGRILSAADKTIRSFSWKGQAGDFSWDGTDEAGNRVMDGAYRYEVSSTDAAGNRGSATLSGITVDARLPQVFVTASAPGLSPNGDGFMDDLTFSLIVNLKEGIKAWKFSLLDTTGAERASFGGGGEDLPSRILWDGKTSSGAVTEGEYRGLFSVEYLKGDRAEATTGGIIVDVSGPAVDLQLSPDFFSPDNDGVDDELLVELGVKDASEIANWKFEIDEASVEESPGQKPRERLFASWSGKGVPTKQIVWDGRSTRGELVEAATDYPFYFEIADVYGNRTKLSGAVAVDVLVIREGDRLKIKVPSIVFRPNFADFVGLEAETLERNKKVIARIAEILNKFKDYRIAIEGHANSVGKIYDYSAAKIADEEEKELIPLSTARAELVKQLLIENGVDGRRLSVLGRGSSAPVVDFKDAVNRWKNRRVEFILIKNQ